MTMQPAVTEYLRREAEANKRPEGADCPALFRAVADEYGVSVADLEWSVFNATVLEAN